MTSSVINSGGNDGESLEVELMLVSQKERATGESRKCILYVTVSSMYWQTLRNAWARDQPKRLKSPIRGEIFC